MRTVTRRWTVLSISAISVGCSSVEPTPPPAAIEIIFGESQLGAVGDDLALPLLVRVTDTQGHGYGDVDVSFSVTSGNAVLNGIWEDCSPTPDEFGNPAPSVSVNTTADGYAWVSMTPASFGTIIVQAEVHGSSVAPATFTAYVSDPGARLEIADPYEPEVIAGPQRIHDFGIVVRDGQGDGAPAVPVIWEVTSGGARLLHGSWGCTSERTATGGVINRTSTVQDAGAAGYSSVGFQATAFGVTTVTATVAGVPGPPATFTVNATKVEIAFYTGSDGEPKFLGPEYSPDVTVPIGATVEWWNQRTGAHITSVTVPQGGSSFDSGGLSDGERFQFVPDVAGTWQYADEISGAQGTLTASRDLI